jgi:histidinol phosphatase-like PHP family hydrolase
MKYQIDHDLHLHTHLSKCSSDPAQTTERILQYAIQNNLHTICVTNHCWDSRLPGMNEFYTGQDCAHLAKSLPLPQAEQVRFLYGCETDVDKNGRLGLAPESIDQFDFIIIPLTHLHMLGFTLEKEDCTVERLTELYIKRFEWVLAMDLPFHKIGFAHPTTPLLANGNWDMHLAVLNNITDEAFTRVFRGIAERGAGVELNMLQIFRYTEEELPIVLRPYRIARDCGCKFYLGSDAHHPEGLDTAMSRFERMLTLLDLDESDKFNVAGLR